MASINKLSIRGVRSFSPDEEEQVIEFLKPVTIIVGANGCGKTTIIESLKYAVTGSLPPGKNPGQSFVHDPKSIGQASVKASVKLRFTNRANGVMVLVRSMEVTQKKTKLTFSSLDGVLRTTDAQGKRVSMSHKCNELDRQVPLILGVSKPILEHVVFCHQEDASWPLQDSAVLKKRFDDIFDSTRYTKALKNIDEIKKEYRDKVKDLKADLAGLASHKHAANEYRAELSSQNEKLETLEEEVQGAADELKRADKLMEQHKDVIDQMEELNADLDDRNQEWERQQAVLDTQQSYLEEDLTEKHSARELKDMLRDFEEQAEKRNEARLDLERDRERLREDMEAIAKEANECMSERGKLASDKERFQEMLQQRLQTMEDLAEKWGIELSVTQSQSQSVAGSQDSTSILNISEGDMRAFMKALHQKQEALDEELKSHKARSVGAEDEIGKVLSDLHAREISFDSDKKKILQQIRDAQKELLSLKSQAGGGRTRQGDIDEAKRQSEKYSKDRDKANNDPRKSEIPVEIRSYEDKIDKLKRSIDDDTQALRDLRLNADSENEINVLKEQVAKDMEALQELVTEQNFDLDRFKLTAPQIQIANDDHGEELVIAMEKLSSEAVDQFDNEMRQLEKATKDVTSSERTVSEKSALLTHNKQSLSSTRARLDALTGDEGSVSTYQRVISAIRQYANGAGIVTEFDEKDPQTVVSFLTEQLEELDEMTDDAVEVGRKLIKKLKMMARVNDDEGNLSELRCPCCLTGLEVEQLKKFKKNMDELMDPAVSSLFKTNPEKVQRDRATKKNFERWRKTISNSMGDISEHKRLVVESQNLTNTVKELEAAVAEQEQELLTLNTDKDDIQSRVDDLRVLSDLTKRWVEDANRMSTKKMRINSKNDDLSMSMTAMSTMAGNRDLRTVERELEEKREEKDTLMTRIARLNKEMTQLNTRVSNLSQQASRFENLVKDREARFAEEQQAASRKTELNESIRKWQEDEKKVGEQMAALRPKVRAKEQEKQKQREHAKEEEERLSKNTTGFSVEVSGLDTLQENIQRFADNLEENNLDALNEKLAKLDDKKKEKESGVKAIEPELERVIRSINDQESHRKLIQGNIDLIQVRARMKELKKEIDGLKEDLEKIDGHDVAIQEYEAAKETKSQVLDSKARLEGRRNGFFEQITGLKRKLKTPEYKNIDERHRHAMIKHNTTQIAVSDLDKYHNAVDKALLRYHGIKIAEINKIIRELWTLTYKGQDITNIEIVSGTDSGSKATKSYNYRVVMTKGGTQLDMRGRCSAGQRVLASIVIRLALAETFCVQFGCIALDEPTVNLDYNNKKGLAIALAQIISARANQSNFQLVVITHDEDFVSMMKTELMSQTGFSMPERYYQVRREEGADNKFYSKIDSVDWNELV